MKRKKLFMRNMSMDVQLSHFPGIFRQDLPALTTAQMREVDTLMLADYGIALLQMMENAGRNLADVAQVMLRHDVQERPVLVLAGRGNNGGGGLVAARHLANRGAEVQVMLSRAMEDFDGVPAQQLETLLAMGVSVSTTGDGWELPSADLIIDALIGYGLHAAPRPADAGLIHLANSHPAPILALDAPAGLDATRGQVCEPVIRAAATMTLALPKMGLFAAPDLTGILLLADISVPPMLYEDLGLTVAPIFNRSPILRVV